MLRRKKTKNNFFLPGPNLLWNLHLKCKNVIFLFCCCFYKVNSWKKINKLESKSENGSRRKILPKFLNASLSKTTNDDSISRPNSRPQLPFPGNGMGNLKCHGKQREGKFEACITGNHGKREFPLTPASSNSKNTLLCCQLCGGGRSFFMWRIIDWMLWTQSLSLLWDKSSHWKKILDWKDHEPNSFS